MLIGGAEMRRHVFIFNPAAAMAQPAKIPEGNLEWDVINGNSCAGTWRRGAAARDPHQVSISQNALVLRQPETPPAPLRASSSAPASRPVRGAERIGAERKPGHEAQDNRQLVGDALKSGADKSGRADVGRADRAHADTGRGIVFDMCKAFGPRTDSGFQLRNRGTVLRGCEVAYNISTASSGGSTIPDDASKTRMCMTTGATASLRYIRWISSAARSSTTPCHPLSVASPAGGCLARHFGRTCLGRGRTR
ncbi:hypothetical protein ATI53_101148 [Salipiger aestuarii]|uniref:Uncharacterized protein n=1 Tax=Salipiger aestuarii TaxID=568098 RepID=A0A327YCF3_9RHOB|nr:hypothetical protein ATI53_101148 [Salipiger aestuarii]